MNRRIYYWFGLGAFNVYLYSIAPNNISIGCGIFCVIAILFDTFRKSK